MGVDESESTFSLYELFSLGQNLSGPENMVFGQGDSPGRFNGAV